MSRARAPKDPRLPLTTRVLDEGPTAAVAPDDVESRVYRECGPAAAGRISEISEKQTRAPDFRRRRAPPRMTRASLRGEVHWHGRCNSVQSQSHTAERTCLRTRQRLKNPFDGSRSSALE